MTQQRLVKFIDCLLSTGFFLLVNNFPSGRFSAAEETTESDSAMPPLKHGQSQAELTPVKDNAQQFEQIKHHKQALLQGIEMFNWETKKVVISRSL